MLRTVGGVVAGYLAMAVLVMVSFTVVYLVMGADGAFKPGTYQPSTGWILVSFVLSLAAAALGGWVSVLVGRGAKAATILAGAVFVVGMVLAVMNLDRPALENPVRLGEVGNLEAMQKAKEPTWVAFTNPILGAVGVLAGARLRKTS